MEKTKRHSVNGHAVVVGLRPSQFNQGFDWTLRIDGALRLSGFNAKSSKLVEADVLRTARWMLRERARP